MSYQQACADIKGSESTVESVECIAKWKEGSTYYFLGLISRDHINQYDYEDRFRCFAYQEIFQVIHYSIRLRDPLNDSRDRSNFGSYTIIFMRVNLCSIIITESNDLQQAFII